MISYFCPFLLWKHEAHSELLLNASPAVINSSSLMEELLLMEGWGGGQLCRPCRTRFSLCLLSRAAGLAAQEEIHPNPDPSLRWPFHREAVPEERFSNTPFRQNYCLVLLLPSESQQRLPVEPARSQREQPRPLHQPLHQQFG